MDSKREPISMASQVVDVALKAGAEAADAFVRSSSSLSMSVRNGETESLQKASTFGLGLRVMVDSRTVLVHTTDTGRIGLLKLVTRAIDMARTLPEPKEPVPFGSPQDVESLPHPDPALASESSETKTERLCAIEKAMLAVNGVTRSGGVSYNERDSEDILVNSEGIRLSNSNFGSF
ncbi:MAG: hypothetical protein KAY24_09840, partial [Candidatus Eisenbacteria sp.]|nr:hypothetical protein [Candidatus Eisenbacteria bacterium]